MIVPIYFFTLRRALLLLAAEGMRESVVGEVHFLFEEFVAYLLLDCAHIVAQVVFVPVAASVLGSKADKVLMFSLSRCCLDGFFLF